MYVVSNLLCTGEGEFDVLYASQILNFGKEYQQALASKSALVVGAGVFISVFLYFL